MASADFSAEHTRILQLTGWTADEIHSLVHERKCPDHWWEDPRPTFGLMEIIRKCVDDTESLSFRKDFVNILKSMGIKEPNCTLPGILSKVKRSALKAISADNLESLCEEYTDLSGSNRVIGSACQQLGITPGLLKEGCSNLQGDISNGIIVELFHYRRRNSIPWKTVLDEWWCALFPEKTGEVPHRGTVISSWKSVATRRIKLSRDSSRERLEEFLRTPYCYPTKRPINEEQLEDDHPDGNEPPLTTKDDSELPLTTIDDSNEDIVSTFDDATKNKRIVMKRYQDKVKDMKKERQEMMDRQQQAKEEKKRKSVATAVRATEMVNKLCDGPCTSSADVESMMAKKAPSDQRKALLAQIDYYKSVNKGLVKGALFFKSKAGKPLSASDLCDNLKEIIQVVHSAPIGQSEDAESGTSCTFPDSDTLQEERKALREKLLSKVTGRKRKEPFPETTILHKRIKHKFLPEGGKRLVTYHGRVLRKSTQQDIEDLMECNDQEYFDKGYTFYTLVYDNDENLYTYPLEKEWEDNCLELM